MSSGDTEDLVLVESELGQGFLQHRVCEGTISQIRGREFLAQIFFIGTLQGGRDLTFDFLDIT